MRKPLLFWVLGALLSLSVPVIAQTIWTFTKVNTIAPITIGPITLSSSSFNAVAGNANSAIGTLTIVSSSGTPIPTFTLDTACGANCADSSLFAISGSALKIGTSDITTARAYNISVIDTDSLVGVTNSPYEQHLVVTGTHTQTGGAQWLVAHQDGCVQVSGTTIDWVCQMRWRDSFANDSLAVDVAWRSAAPTALSSLPISSFVVNTNNASSVFTCSAISGAFANDSSIGASVQKFLCPNLPYPVSEFDAEFTSPLAQTTFTGSISGTVMTVTSVGTGPILATNEFVTGNGVSANTTITGQTSGTPGGIGAYTVNISQNVASETMTVTVPASNVVVRTTELYGCTNPCVAEVGNGSVTASANGVMSIATSGATTSANDLIQSFAYGPSDTFASPSGVVISNATSGVSSFLTQYQIGSTTGTYTNSFTTSNAKANVLQAIAAFKQNSAPPVASPTVLGQQVYTVLDTAVAGTPVNGGVYAYDNATYQLIFNPISLSTNPGGLLAFNPATKALTVANTLTPSNDGTYAGQLSVTQNSTTINQPISLIVQPARAYPSGPTSNCPTTPPPAAQRAGYTFLAYCLDPASAHYQTLANWIDCTNNDGNPNGFEWYTDWASILCADLSFPTDSAGRKVLEMHWHSTTDINAMRAAGSTASIIKTKTVQGTSQGQNGTVRMPIANSYWEYRASTYPLINDNLYPNPSFDIFAWTNCPLGVAGICTSNPAQYTLIEADFSEYYGPRYYGGAQSFHFWNDQSFGYNLNNVSPFSQPQIAATIPGWSPANTMASYGMLFTNDAAAGLRISGFVNDVLIPGTAAPIGRAAGGGTINPYDIGLLPTWSHNGGDNRTAFQIYNYWIMWFGGDYGLTTSNCQASPQCVAAGGQPDTFVDMEYITGWTCPQYLTDPTCATTTKGLAQ